MLKHVHPLTRVSECVSTQVCVRVCVTFRGFFKVTSASTGFNFHHSWIPFDQLTHLSVSVTSKNGSVVSSLSMFVTQCELKLLML